MDASRYERFAVGKSDPAVDRVLRGLVRDAYENVASFRLRLDQAGVWPDEIWGLNDLGRLPLMSRATFDSPRRIDHLRRGIDPAKCTINWTSGTTGQQLPVHMSKTESLYRQFLLLRAIRRHLGGSLPRSITEVGISGSKQPGVRRAFGLVKVTRIARDEPPIEQVRRLAESKPTVITGHPTCLELVAESTRTLKQTIRPRLVVCRGEILLPSTRALLADVFKCRVADFYNCDEVGNIAWECPQHSDVLHINTDGCIVEVVGEDGRALPQGQAGRVVVTNLFNRTMPFIRYGLGDLTTIISGSDSRCTCGYRGPSLTPVLGREMQFFRLADGTRVSQRTVATFVNQVLRNLKQDTQVQRYQVIQERIDRVHVRILAHSELPSNVIDAIAREIERLGPEIRCSVELVDDLPADASGKFRRFISKV